jgi:5-hydroxyisourate hydrolase-like protein (transthyretin family)
MTRRIYTHVTDAMLGDAAEAIEAAAATVSDDEIGSLSRSATTRTGRTRRDLPQ